MKIRTKIRAGALSANRNAKKGIKVKTKIRSGSLSFNHNAKKAS